MVTTHAYRSRSSLSEQRAELQLELLAPPARGQLCRQRLKLLSSTTVWVAERQLVKQLTSGQPEEGLWDTRSALLTGIKIYQNKSK